VRIANLHQETTKTYHNSSKVKQKNNHEADIKNVNAQKIKRNLFKSQTKESQHGAE